MSLAEKVKNAPSSPGCYIFKDREARVIYVGKSKKLQYRVRQYFQKANQKDRKGIMLAKEICDVEFMVTPTERDALILEYKLIKQYRPWFNMQYKKDRHRPYIRIGNEADFPSLVITREKSGKTGQYFGLFYNEDDAMRALTVLHKVYRIPLCQKSFPDSQERECLNFHMNKCMAPCTGQAGISVYKNAIREIKQLFRGKKVPAMSRLKKEMLVCSKEMNFEKALEIKQLITELERLRMKNQRIFHLPDDKDVIIFMRAYRETGFSVFYISKKRIKLRFDYDSTDTFYQQGLEEFFWRLNEVTGFQCDDGTLECLTEVIADKLFIVLPGKCSREKCEEIINNGLSVFL